jgi:hypothetical protein
MNERLLRRSVVGVDLFEATSAILGAAGLAIGFMGVPLSVLAGTPFQDFTVPALLLGFVVGGSALAAAIITAFGPPGAGALASGAAGCITVGWLIVEIAMIGLGSWAQIFWMFVGLLMIGLSALLWQAESRAAGVAGSHQPI